MVLRRRKFYPFDVDRIFEIVEEQVRRSLEFTKRIFEKHGMPEEFFEGYRVPLVDILDEGDKYIIEVELPGLRKEDIEIYTYDNILEIIAKRKIERKEEEEGIIRLERAYSGFRRAFTLPTDADVDKIKAKYENGLLIIEIPKRGESSGRKKVDVE
ncbi:MAG TPA: Hsp20/alpha crystallin family protein [Candidatus Nanopusillus sp.]|nr:Hsp20/alpha crystallin family protein [Candidatus Nanopusillus sp.]HIP90431.1 Hsp20/alpha crystallin family protein [Candidatus Nanopusillus sp.]